jgi:outer membrane protein OmpA-like peptidoglycan-associated protein
VLTALMVALCSGSAAAADSGFTAGLAGGWFWYDEDDNVDSTWTAVPRLGWQLNPLLTVEADLGFQQSLTTLDRTINLFTPRANLLIHPFTEWRVQPFVAVGPGLYLRHIPEWEFEDIQGGVSQGDRGYQNPDLDFMVNGGPGVMVPLTNTLHLRSDFRFTPVIGLGESYVPGDSAQVFSDWEWTMGLSLRPGDRVADLDADGIIDAEDACVEEPEDADGYLDEDGCPDPDNDGDTLADVDDQCPNEPEDLDGFADDDGCSDPDNDGDGFADASDACPDVAGHESAGGCPDRDGDRVVDASDACPDEYGEGADGCKPPVVAVAEEEIVILEKVLFETGSDVIDTRSYSLLDEVSAVLKEHPELARVEVAGHTDSVGARGFNLDLSRRRAQAVMAYLTNQGVDAGRLLAEGYGPDEPIADNGQEDGRDKNRRVEFKILERDAATQ